MRGRRLDRLPEGKAYCEMMMDADYDEWEYLNSVKVPSWIKKRAVRAAIADVRKQDVKDIQEVIEYFKDDPSTVKTLKGIKKKVSQKGMSALSRGEESILKKLMDAAGLSEWSKLY